MPPKKASGAAQAAKAVNKKKQAEDKQVPSRAKQEQKDDVVMEDETTNPKDEAVKEDQKEEAPAEEKAETGQKRKTPPTSGGSKPPKKEQRQGSRVSSRTAGAGAGKDATSKQIVNFLLSKDSLPYCYPSDELEAANSGKFKKCYSLTPPSLFTPFEHLVTAHLISKPLSHTLGMRSARTLLNDPYSFGTPGKMRAAGEKKIWDALEEARTQHRQKTASYLYDMAVQYSDPNNKGDTGDMGDSDEMLELATRANDGGSRATIEYIKSTVKGMGDTGAQIFCRRVQACEGWGEAIWPYADPRSIDALRELGVKVADAENLQEMIESDVDWDKVGDMGLLEEKKGVDDKDYEVQVAVELVTVLERAIGCVLEGKVDQLRSAAAGFGK
ncbi:hypothetical protein LTS08_008237 [Lithohypha guttulata]|nr:hypothetical protein LTS08_008237 [Lithohypha guttulata]